MNATVDKILDSDAFAILFVIAFICVIFSSFYFISSFVGSFIEISDGEYKELLACSANSSVLVLINESMVDSKITYSEFHSIKDHCDYLSSSKLSLESLIQGDK